ncbi:hypothetical protein J1N35_011004 [Gossypium stocksii]|uniref:Uncharacterized protein n=1 Tax=Gossypium stocksii TaxID=47602 RepID=A0A9D4AD94_9ROSI|nr:hypothetical protein J1N35_011004 [Gossypium stocksii]
MLIAPEIPPFFPKIMTSILCIVYIRHHLRFKPSRFQFSSFELQFNPYGFSFSSYKLPFNPYGFPFSTYVLQCRLRASVYDILISVRLSST